MRIAYFRRSRLPDQEKAVEDFGKMAARQSDAIMRMYRAFPDTPIPNKIAILHDAKKLLDERYQPYYLKRGSLISDVPLGKKGK